MMKKIQEFPVTLVWQESTNDGITLISAGCEQMGENSHQQAVNQSVDKAIELLPLNIDDDSMYIIFEWDAQQLLLSIAVTDETKTKDAERCVQCRFSRFDSSDMDDTTEDIRYWIRDYLTTCDAFMRFSLIAIFHSGDRQRVDLL
jgi:hypothetical protein